MTQDTYITGDHIHMPQARTLSHTRVHPGLNTDLHSSLGSLSVHMCNTVETLYIKGILNKGHLSKEYIRIGRTQW